MNNKINSSIYSTSFALSRKAKESIKFGIAFTMAYGIALASGWLNPYWAGFAVAMISFAPPGLSLKKGILRAAGTVPGCFAAIIIFAIAPQERWLFLTISCTFIFFTTYMMIVDQNKPYFWNVTGFTCLVILTTAAGSNNNDFFQHAVMRSVETLMGVIVYSLISIFIWPQRHTGAIKQAYRELILSQNLMLRNCQAMMQGKSSSLPLTEFSHQQVALLAKFTETIQAEGSENIKIFNNRNLLKGLTAICTAQMECLQKWQLNLSILPHIDFNQVLPQLNEYFTQQIQRVDEIEQILMGKKTTLELCPISLLPDPSILKTHSHYDQAAISLTLKELKEVDENIMSSINYVQGLMGVLPIKQIDLRPIPLLTQKICRPTWAILHRAAFPPIVMVVSFLIWIYINPPGHASFFQLPAIIAMMVSGMQQLKLTVLLKNFLVAIPICLCIYVFVLPNLSSFTELAVVLFVIIFLLSYFFSGYSKVIGLISVVNIISIQNEQTYNFAAILNTSIFMILSVYLAYSLSYLLQSSRPEKTMQTQIQYFFKKALWLSTQSLFLPEKKRTVFFKCQLALNLNEVTTLPQDIGNWGKFIDYKNFNKTSPQQVQELVIALQILSYRIQQLCACTGLDSRNIQLNNHLARLKRFIEEPLQIWSKSPNAGNEKVMRQQFNDMEHLTTQMMEQIGNSASKDEIESMLLIIASYRGVSEANLNYLQAAQTVNWAQWRQERFS